MIPGKLPSFRKPWLTLLILAAAVAIWVIDQERATGSREKPRPAEHGKATTAPVKQPPSLQKKPSAGEKSGPYEVYRNCTLASHRNNDGDSFMLHLPDGRKAEFRLYFVDTPESAFKRYSGGETNHQRIRQQAADLGGITPEQAVETGRKAKSFTLDLLGREPFTIHTCWDSPYHDQRYHAFVEVRQNGASRWLHELLVERGLARIRTKPADLPDGTPASKQRQHLRQLERSARQNAAGAWGM